MHALEIINALNDPDNPAKPKGLNAKLSGASDRCTGQCGSVKGHPRHGKCDAGWPPNNAEGRIEEYRREVIERHGPICPRCEHLNRGKHNDTVFVRSNHGAMLYSCNECKLEFYG